MKTISIVITVAAIIISCLGLLQFIIYNKTYVDVFTKKDNKSLRISYIILYVINILTIAASIVTSEITSSLVALIGSIFAVLSIIMIKKTTSEVKEISIDLSTMLVNAIEFREKNFKGHSNYVTELVCLLYKYIPKERQNEINFINLKVACLLHNIGMLGISDDILNKEGSLTYDEWQLMQIHPIVGKDILMNFHDFECICEWVYYHHERIDGNGYYKMPGDKIPYPSKMIALADTYSAITSKRPHKEKKSYEEAIKILKECKGTQLDEELVNIFVNMV